MFGGTPICPRCSKAVYAAEQVMGPGRKLYHKPCLACMQCNKRLDSYTLLEHNEQPYCKSCHLKSFGTPNLRHANLPTSPIGGSPIPNRRRSISPTPLRPISTGTGSSNGYGTGNGNLPYLKLRPNRSLTSPTSPTFARPSADNIVANSLIGASVNLNDWGGGRDPDEVTMISSIAEEIHPEDPQSESDTDIQKAYESTDMQVEDRLELDASSTADDIPGESTRSTPPPQSIPAVNRNRNSIASISATNTGRPGIGTLPRTVPLRHMTSRSVDVTSLNSYSPSPSISNTIPSSPTSPSSLAKFSAYSQLGSPPISPILPSFATGTRYGIALMGGVPSHSTGGIILGENTTVGGGMRVGMIPTSTGGSPRKTQWGVATPSCGRCGKNVYFAEQVKAIGKTFHKTCLRCNDCGTSLDSHKLRDHDGQPYCVRCYQKAYGPQGNGYALLGKAGG